jgi:uncharacterized protein (DUF1810 family)
MVEACPAPAYSGKLAVRLRTGKRQPALCRALKKHPAIAAETPAVRGLATARATLRWHVSAPRVRIARLRMNSGSQSANEILGKSQPVLAFVANQQVFFYRGGLRTDQPPQCVLVDELF